MISSFNTRIRIRKYSFSQDVNGYNVKTLISYYDVWASIQNMNGSSYMANLAVTYNKSFKITTRYERSRPLSTLDEIEYEGNTYTIASLELQEEGRKNYNVMIVYTNNIMATVPGS